MLTYPKFFFNGSLWACFRSFQASKDVHLVRARIPMSLYQSCLEYWRHIKADSTICQMIITIGQILYAKVHSFIMTLKNKNNFWFESKMSYANVKDTQILIINTEGKGRKCLIWRKVWVKNVNVKVYIERRKICVYLKNIITLLCFLLSNLNWYFVLILFLNKC